MSNKIKTVSRGFIKSIEALQKSHADKGGGELSLKEIGILRGRAYDKSSPKYRFLTTIASLLFLRAPKGRREVEFMKKLSMLKDGSSVGKKTKKFGETLYKSAMNHLLDEISIPNVKRPSSQILAELEKAHIIASADQNKSESEANLKKIDHKLTLFFDQAYKNCFKKFGFKPNIRIGARKININGKNKDFLKAAFNANMQAFHRKALALAKANDSRLEVFLSKAGIYCDQYVKIFPEVSWIGLMVEMFKGVGITPGEDGSLTPIKDDWIANEGYQHFNKALSQKIRAYHNTYPNNPWPNFEMKSKEKNLNQQLCTVLIELCASNFSATLRYNEDFLGQPLLAYNIKIKIDSAADLAPRKENGRNKPPLWLEKALQNRESYLDPEIAPGIQPNIPVFYQVTKDQLSENKERLINIKYENNKWIVTLENL